MAIDFNNYPTDKNAYAWVGVRIANPTFNPTYNLLPGDEGFNPDFYYRYRPANLDLSIPEFKNDLYSFVNRSDNGLIPDGQNPPGKEWTSDPQNTVDQSKVALAVKQWENIIDVTNVNVKITFAYVTGSSFGGSGRTYVGGNDYKNQYVIFINQNFAQSTTQVPYTGDLSIGTWGGWMLMHEIGHVLGLTHTVPLFQQGYQKMSILAYPNDIFTDSTPLTPGMLDIAAMQQEFGQSHAQDGNTNFKFTQSNVDLGHGNLLSNLTSANLKNYVMTLWDRAGNEGGLDTIDASSLATKTYIDLRAGHFSAIGTDTNVSLIDGDNGNTDYNVGIAIGAQIENAKGGSASDYLKGNDFDNTLTGNGGNDTLEGGKGTDHLIGGAGTDRYIHKSGDGSDVITDSDGNGQIEFDGLQLQGSTGLGATNWKQYGDSVWKDLLHKITYIVKTESDGSPTLYISNGTSTLTVKNWVNGKLGIDLSPGDNEILETQIMLGDQRAIFINNTQMYDWENSTWQMNGTLQGGVAEANFNDVIYGWGHIYGFGGNDALSGYGIDDDYIDGGIGNDWIAGGAGSDVMYGGEGKDLIMGANYITPFQRKSPYDVPSVPILQGQSLWTEGSTWRLNWDNTLNTILIYYYGMAGSGNPTESNVDPDIIYGGNGDDFILGGNGDDYAEGNNDNDTLLGHGGNDILDGGSGDDLIGGDGSLEAGLYNTTLPEEFGNDVLYGGLGNDSLNGDLGDDFLEGGSGNDRMMGDMINASGSLHGNDFLNGGEGNDTIWGQGGSDILYGGVGDDYLEGDYSTISGGDAGDDYLDGGSGTDQIIGDDGNDTLIGGSGQDSLYGGNGDDVLYGNNDGDLLIGGAGKDIFHVGGADIIGDQDKDDGIGFLGNTNATTTQVVLEPLISNSAVSISLGDAGIFHISNGLVANWNTTYTFSDGSTIRHSDLIGNNLDSAIILSTPSKMIFGGKLNDTLFVTDGTDHFLFGGKGDDDLLGNAGSDVLEGGSGNDELFGDYGNDTLDGGVGSDLLYGGEGSDTYIVDNGDLIDDGYGENLIVTGANLESISVINQSNGYLNIATNANQSFVINNGIISNHYNFKLANGEVISQSNLIGSQMEVVVNISAGQGGAFGGNKNDKLLNVGNINTFLSGGGGNDLLYGAQGIDTYFFDKNIGHDTIFNDDSSANISTDIIEFGPSITAQDISIRRGFGYYQEYANYNYYTNFDITSQGSYDDLYIYINGRGETVTVHDYFLSSSNAHLNIKFSDGTVLNTGSIAQLVDASKVLIGTSSNDHLMGGLFSDNSFYGEQGNDTLEGGAGADFFNGGVGNDLMMGTEGADTYLFDVGSGQDYIVDNDYGNGGIDTILFGYGITASNIQVRRGAGSDLVISVVGSLDTLTLAMQFDLDQSFLIETFVFANGDIWSLDDIKTRLLTGSIGNDTLEGFSTDDLLSGVGGDDYLLGYEGNDTLDGGVGADTMLGGLGEDVYIVDDSNDTVIDELDEGSDLVKSSVSYILSDNLENLTLTGSSGISGTGNELDNTITGNSASNFIIGGVGADILIGGLGNDTYVIDNAGDSLVENANEGYDTVQSSMSYSIVNQINIENVTLIGGSSVNATGNSANNVLMGNYGNNVLDGGSGSDSMAGGAGNDSYVVDDIGDVVSESNAEGADIIQSSVTFTLGANIEKLTLTGIANTDAYGNALANTIVGNAGNNILDGGGTGSTTDSMTGGAGDDLYIVHATADSITEASGGGTDTAQSSATYALSANVENLSLTGTSAINGTGNTLANTLTGNSASNTLDGSTGADTMSGGGGDDIYVVDNAGDVVTELAGQGTDTVRSGITYTIAVLANLENIILTGTGNINATGSDLANTLTGNTGNNTLDGGLGADSMIGGTGNDIYVVDNADDLVTETSNVATEIDTVQSSLASYTLTTNVEYLTLTGTGNIDGTGNSLVNRITGNSGNNTLNGGAGADSLIGGAGDDLYIVDNVGELITEGASAGNDSVNSSVTFELAANVENLTLTGTSAINATGNTSANTLTGNSGANQLNGGTGADIMAGGVGNDLYYVDNVGDVVNENAAEGTDTVSSTITYSIAALANVENITLTGTGNINATGNASVNTLLGNASNNTLDGGTGNDILKGGAGNDTYIVDVTGDAITENASEGTDTVETGITYTIASQANLENITLTGTANVNATGNASVNTLLGNAGNNTLDGGAGADILKGGLGDDTYVVDDAGDAITEATAAGIDLVKVAIATASGSHTLAANVENGTLTNTVAFTLVGNGLDNILTGNAAINTLTGAAGNDTLDGGAQADILAGGTGNDVYIVDNASDTTTENASEGTDTVRSTLTWTLGANLENLALLGSTAINGTGNTLSNFLSGNTGTNVLDGLDGNDILQGMAGTDTLSDTVGKNLYDGGTGNDILTAGDSNDILIGGIGNDTITTGNGYDVISFNKGDGQDLVNATADANTNTLSLGGAFAYSALSLTKTGNNLILKVGSTDQITFKDWYLLPANKSVANLQVIAESITNFSLGSATDPLRDNKIENFNFADIVAAFDTDGATANWTLTDQRLTSHLLTGSDTVAIGGDLAYQYGRNGNLTGVGLLAAQAVMNNSTVGQNAQTLNAATSWQNEAIKLG